MLHAQGRNYQQQHYFARPFKIRHLTPSYQKPVREQVSQELRKIVLEKNSHKCYCCNKENGEKGKRLEMHHIVPVNFGGKTEENNLLPLCFNCHQSVHKLIAALHINPVKFKRSALEDVVLRIAELREQERAGFFARAAPKSEGPMGSQVQHPEPTQDETSKFGLMLFVLSLSMSRRQFRKIMKAMKRQAWKESVKSAA